MQHLSQRIGRVRIEQHLHPGGDIVGQIDELAAARHRHQDRRGAFRQRVLDDIDRVMDRLDRAAEIDAADDGHPAFERLTKQRRG